MRSPWGSDNPFVKINRGNNMEKIKFPITDFHKNQKDEGVNMGGGKETKDEIITRLLATIEERNAVIASLERLIIGALNK